MDLLGHLQGRLNVLASCGMQMRSLMHLPWRSTKKPQREVSKHFTAGLLRVWKKARLCSHKLTYLGSLLLWGGNRRTLSSTRIQAILNNSEPQNKRQVREFLGTVGYCRLGTPNFAEIAQWLCQSLGRSSPVSWEGKEKEKFQTLKEDWCQPLHSCCLTLTTPSTCG